MRNFLAALAILFLASSCVSTYAARKLTSEQIDNAVELLEAHQARGCLCFNGHASPPAGSLRGSVIGTIGGDDLLTCAQICIEFR